MKSIISIEVEVESVEISYDLDGCDEISLVSNDNRLPMDHLKLLVDPGSVQCRDKLIIELKKPTTSQLHPADSDQSS